VPTDEAVAGSRGGHPLSARMSVAAPWKCRVKASRRVASC